MKGLHDGKILFFFFFFFGLGVLAWAASPPDAPPVVPDTLVPGLRQLVRLSGFSRCRRPGVPLWSRNAPAFCCRSIPCPLLPGCLLGWRSPARLDLPSATPRRDWLAGFRASPASFRALALLSAAVRLRRPPAKGCIGYEASECFDRM